MDLHVLWLVLFDLFLLLVQLRDIPALLHFCQHVLVVGIEGVVEVQKVEGRVVLLPGLDEYLHLEALL